MATAKSKSENTSPDAPPKTVTLEAVEPIRIDGADVAPGETFEASPGIARQLLASGVARK